MKHVLSHTMSLLLACAGAYSIYTGLRIEDLAASSIHQVYGSVYVVGGGIIVGLAAVVHATVK